MRPVAIGPCRDLRHEGHEVLVRSHPVGPDADPRGLLTLWRCPVAGWGGFWHDLAHRPEDSHPTGPGLDELP